MRQIAAVLFLAGAWSAQAPAQSALGLIQPDAGFVFGIEWRKIVDSAVGAQLTEQIKKAQLPPIPGIQALQDTLLHDLDSVVIAVPASGLAEGTTAAQPPALVVVKGRFNIAQLRSLAQGTSQKTETYRSVELLVPPETMPAADAKTGPDKTGLDKPGSGKTSPDKTRVAFLDANTILAGDMAEVRAAIDRVKTGRLTAARAGVLAGVSDLASKSDVWMVVDIPAGALKDAPPAAAQMFSGVKGAELGMSFGEGFGLRMNVRTKDEASAASVAQALHGLIAMAAMGQPQTPASTELLKKVQITPENTRVRLSLALDKSEVEKIIQEQQAAAASAPKSQAARAPEPTGPKTIRITGLDSGPVEVPVTGKKNGQ
jgi:ribosomal protein L12E/L44/L45/RPP1/RPP2